jgi:ATP-dependent 26S proteasome regulatory subunit
MLYKDRKIDFDTLQIDVASHIGNIIKSVDNYEDLIIPDAKFNCFFKKVIGDDRPMVCFTVFLSTERLENYIKSHPEYVLVHGDGSFNAHRRHRSFTNYSCIYRLDEDFYFVRYVEQLLEQSYTHGYCVFVGEWTKERVVETIVKVSEKLYKKFLETLEKEQENKEDPMKRVFLRENLLNNILKDVESFLDSADLYRNELGLPWKRGLVFYGPPGNGKTLLIRSISEKYNLPKTDLKECITQDGGLSFDRAVRQDHVDEILFPIARRPALLYVEDLDKFVVDEHKGGSGTITSQELTKALDGVEKVDGVLLIATTNYPNELAECIMNRPGRFDSIYEFKNPEKTEIKSFLKYHRMECDIDFVAKELGTLSMAYVEEFVKSAKSTYRRNKINDKEAKIILDKINEHARKFGNEFKSGRSPGFGKS